MHGLFAFRYGRTRECHLPEPRSQGICLGSMHCCYILHDVHVQTELGVPELQFFPYKLPTSASCSLVISCILVLSLCCDRFRRDLLPVITHLVTRSIAQWLSLERERPSSLHTRLCASSSISLAAQKSSLKEPGWFRETSSLSLSL